jgi:intracellular multiplication protein IcmK
MPAGPSPNPIGDLLGMAPKVQSPMLPPLGGSGAPPALQADTGPAYDFEMDPEELKARARQRAFEAALEGLMPLRPEEIRTLLERYDEVQRSVEVPHYPRPEPLVAVATASLEPGAYPLTVLVAEGNVTTVTFLDVSGAPWPVEDISWAGNFEVVQSGNDDGTHILRITPQSAFAHGNMSVRLLGLNTPLILTLDTARDQVHYRLDIVIPETGPMAKPPLIQARRGPMAGGVEIARVLEGVVPGRFTRLAVTGADGRTSAYRDGDGGATYLRTPLTLLSPGWSAHVASADGMQVYVIDAAPVVLLSDQGRMVRVYLSEREMEGGSGA